MTAADGAYPVVPTPSTAEPSAVEARTGGPKAPAPRLRLRGLRPLRDAFGPPGLPP